MVSVRLSKHAKKAKSCKADCLINQRKLISDKKKKHFSFSLMKQTHYGNLFQTTVLLVNMGVASKNIPGCSVLLRHTCIFRMINCCLFFFLKIATNLERLVRRKLIWVSAFYLLHFILVHLTPHLLFLKTVLVTVLIIYKNLSSQAVHTPALTFYRGISRARKARLGLCGD